MGLDDFDAYVLMAADGESMNCEGEWAGCPGDASCCRVGLTCGNSNKAGGIKTQDPLKF